jgi:hypothetical protein
MPADLDPGDLAEVRRRIVDTVVGCLIRPDELEDVCLTVDRGGWMNAVITARGERLVVFIGDSDDDPWDAQDEADLFYSRFTDDLPCTGFAWAEERRGTFTVPPPAEG